MKSIKNFRLVSFVVAILSVWMIYSCKQVTSEIIPSEKFATYISGYTGGSISQNSVIRIELSQDLPSVELNTEVKGRPFKFTPSLKGKAYWVSNNTIEFVPEEGALKSGKMYEATFNLGDYIDVEKDLRKFTFTFRVIERNFSLNIHPIYISDEDPEIVQVRAHLILSDEIEKTQVEKMVSAKMSNGKTPVIKVEPTDTPTQYLLSFEDIRKPSKNETLTITIDGKPVKSEKTISQSLTIPGKEKFVLLGAEQVTEPENGLRLTFSEPLMLGQDLRGLIEVKNVRTTTQIDGNVVTVFFERTRTSTIQLDVVRGIKSVSGQELEESSTQTFDLVTEEPQVELLVKGTILPDSKRLIIPFRAISLHAVDLSVIRIYESNVLMFLQDNPLSGSSELRRAGRLVYKKTLNLDSDPEKDITRWEDYSIDLSTLIHQEPGAIYRIMLSFKQEYSAYPCNGNQNSYSNNANLTKIVTSSDESDDNIWDVPRTYYNLEYEGFDWSVYDWERRDDPCHPSYYMNYSRKAFCNVLATNLGMIVKRNSNNKIWVAVSDILTTKPVQGIDVTAYNFQLQPIGQTKTNEDGFAVLEPKGVPFVLVATDGVQKTYLKVIDGTENSTSRFDVGGKEIKKGLKGFIYGERGVWRPGDTLHVSFVLYDLEKRIPNSHPVSIELFNPLGQFYNKQISTNGVSGFYTFHIPTKADDPTGMWNAYVKVGGTSFHKSLRIETVKPNRLKINLTLPSKIINASEGSIRASLHSSWLTGATASALKTKVELKLSKVNTQFVKYKNFIFNNPATDFASHDMELFNGSLNTEGNADFAIQLPKADDAPGLLNAHITTRVFEPGGDASINTQTVPFSPYDAYIGLNLNNPKDKYYIETDADHVFDVVTVDASGNLINRSNLEYKVYRIGWSWWWERDRESFASYINNTSNEPVTQGSLRTINGKASFTFRVNYPDWGRYLVYVKDRTGGHATGGVVFIDWPSWRGRSSKKDPSGVTMLSFSLDKESYEIGEKATAIIPASSEGRALVSLENGTAVLHHEWVEVSGSGDTKYEFTVTPEMAPNVYLHITLLQPHAQTQNDLPIRMYGVMPVMVTNKQTILEPQIKMPDVLRPETTFNISVSEKSGKPMTYTLAIVDDGLLDLTNFKTPNPWDEFYAREALGIRTWDMFDEVIGAHSGAYGLLFSTGGDEMLKRGDAKANRFRPVVKYLGPFTLKKGDSNTHKIQFPMYVGSVRTMVVAGQDGAYGSAEKTTPVRSPLMLLPTLPRVLSTNEDLVFPVNVFAMEAEVKNVTVSIETSSNLKLTGGNKQSIVFSKPGDKMVYFPVKTGNITGKETVKITASGGGQTTSETIEIDVRNPNPMVTLTDAKVINGGQNAEFSYSLSSASKDNWVKMELSRIPPIDFSRRFDYLYSYIHCCTEQLTSKAMPLIFIPLLKDVNEKESEMIRKNVKEGIKQLYGRQLSNGGFIYWPGNSSADEWITSYAGNFLVLAKEMGYDVNANVLNKWKNYQRSAAQHWTPISRDSEWYYWQSDLQQAYRLYTLALAGTPELGAMNRLKEVKELSLQAKWRLAAAYAISGKNDAANELVFNMNKSVEPYSSNNHIYGSYDRDEAMILETLAFMGRADEAYKQGIKVSENLSKTNYFNTQSTAFALVAMARLAEKTSGSIDVEYTMNNGKTVAVKSAKAVWQTELPAASFNGKVSVKNREHGLVYVNVISRTQLLNDTLPEIANNLRLDVRYEDVKGNPVRVEEVKQGTDFVAVIKVSNTSATSVYRDIALTYTLPTGWEVYNERMINMEGGSVSNFDYQDIRDDKVLTYFGLNNGKYKEFKVRLQATYVGTFVLPAVYCEAMYDVTVQARTKARYTTVVRR